MEFEDLFSIHNRFSILPTLPEEPQNECSEQQLSSTDKSMNNQQQLQTSSNVLLSNGDVSLAMNQMTSQPQYSTNPSSFNSNNVVSVSASPMTDSSLNSIMDYQVTRHATPLTAKKTNHSNSANNCNNAIVSNNRHALSYVDSSLTTASYPSNHQQVVSSDPSCDMYSMSLMSSETMKQQQQQQQLQYQQQQPIVATSGYYQPSQGMHVLPKTHHSGQRMLSNASSGSHGQLFQPPLNTNIVRTKNISRAPFERSSSLPLYQNKQQLSLDSYSSMTKTGSEHHASSSLIAQLLHSNNSPSPTSQQQSNQLSSQYHPLQPQTYSSTMNPSTSNMRSGYRSSSSYPQAYVASTPSPPFIDSGINTLSPTSTLSSPSQSLDSPISPVVHAQQHKPSTLHHRSRPHSVRFAVDDSQAYSSSIVKKETPVRKISSPARICSNHPAAQQNPFKEPQSPVMSPSSTYSSHQRLSPKSPSMGVKKGILLNHGASSSHQHLGGHSSPTHSVHSDHHHDKTQYKEHRRVCHINAEQKRRCNIKNGFDTLRQILPSVSQNTNTKISKAAMLAKAAEHIRQLKHDSRVKMEECDHYKSEIDSFNQAIR